MNAPLTLEVNLYGSTYTVWPELLTYGNDRLAVCFNCDEGPFGVLTVNMPNDHLNDGEVFVKDWSEGEPLFKACLDAGWIKLTGREVMSGYVAPKVATLAGPLAELADRR